MKKRFIVFGVLFLLFAGFAFYLSQSGLSKGGGLPRPPEAATQTGNQPGTEKEPAEAAKPEAAKEDAPAVEIPSEKQQLIGVKTAQVSVRPLEKVIRTVGRIEYDERRLATINTKFEGYIERLYVDYSGRYVRKGEALAEIYSPELFATQQEYLNLIKWSGSRREGAVGAMLVKDADVALDAARRRLRLWDITDAEIARIESMGAPIRRLIIYSPVSGYVVQKTVVQGSRVMPGERLFEIVDLSVVWVTSEVYEYELPFVAVGQDAAITLSYFPGKRFVSKIEYVYPTLTGETRTAKIRFAIANPGGALKPQMFSNVEIRLTLGKRLAIPEDAVIDTGTRSIVYVDKGEGYFEPREVLLGERTEELREVLRGLKAGEKVATSAAFLIDSEAKLKGVVPLGGDMKPKQTGTGPSGEHSGH